MFLNFERHSIRWLFLIMSKGTSHNLATKLHVAGVKSSKSRAMPCSGHPRVPTDLMTSVLRHVKCVKCGKERSTHNSSSNALMANEGRRSARHGRKTSIKNNTDSTSNCRQVRVVFHKSVQTNFESASNRADMTSQGKVQPVVCSVGVTANLKGHNEKKYKTLVSHGPHFSFYLKYMYMYMLSTVLMLFLPP